MRMDQEAMSAISSIKDGMQDYLEAWPWPLLGRNANAESWHRCMQAAVEEFNRVRVKLRAIVSTVEDCGKT